MVGVGLLPVFIVHSRLITLYLNIANIIKSRTLSWVDFAARRIHRFDPKMSLEGTS